VSETLPVPDRQGAWPPSGGTTTRRPDHERRERAESFGAVADVYDRVRPGYPAQLVDDLVPTARASPVGPGPAGCAPGAGASVGALRVLDVGCGTGKAARLFLERGCDVLGVEVDPEMANVARLSGVPVEIERFESWATKGRRFDLVVSGQAWHWVDPALGNEKAASHLSPGGRLALFWNYQRSIGGESPEVLARCYEADAPSLAQGTTVLGRFDHEAETASHVRAIELSGRFDPAAVWRYGWRCRYGRDEWLDLLRTLSDHRALRPGVLASLLAAVGAAVDDLGGSVDVDYETVCIVATARPGAQR
jgi:SAM-dependent methyltransferase